MKNCLLLAALLFFFTTKSFSQSFQILADVSSFRDGYNVTCHGATDGSVDASVLGGASPYTYLWSNGATTQDLTGIGAGTYTLTCTDNNSHTATKTVTLIEPDVLSVSLRTSDYHGYGISVHGGSDGTIDANVSGGSPSYTYQWNINSTQSSVLGLQAGTYSVTVTDANSCTAVQSATLTQPGTLTITSITSQQHHGYNVSCNRGEDGAIDLSVSGGVTPYSYSWSNGSFSEDLSDLPADEYDVQVTDANGARANSQITLTEPDVISTEFTPSTYPNSYNVSCFGCFNGSVTTSVSGGITPYTYTWSSGPTTANLSGIGGGDYVLTVTDANSCASTPDIYLTEPPDGWTMEGNAGTDPNTQFIGTTDQTDVAFKTNSTDVMRLTSDGNVGIGTTAPEAKLEVNGNVRIDSLGFESDSATAFRLVGSTRSGELYTLGSNLIAYPCETPTLAWYQNECAPSADIFKMPMDGNVGIGIDNPTAKVDIVSDGNTNSTFAFRVRSSDGSQLLQISDAGFIGIGTASPTAKLEMITAGNSASTVAMWIKNSSQQTLIQLGDDGKLFCPGSIYGGHVNSGALTLSGNSGSDNGGCIELYAPNETGKESEVAVIGNKVGFYRYDGSNWQNSMLINENGQVGINWEFPNGKPSSNNYKLCVNGKIFAQGETIQISSSWPDYVFKNDYKQLSLGELQTYIDSTGHLPGMPSSKEVETNGMNLEQINVALVKNIEELSLYILKLQHDLDEIRKVIIKE